LMMLHQDDCYGYEVSKEIGSILDVKEGTIYLILQRLEKTTHVESYLKEANNNKTRKYYRLTNLGQQRMEELIDDYSTINKVINKYIPNSIKEEK
ncbi:MAG: PadR family transcriptional regulator, partial [Erysipelotrichales bacterium]